MKSIVIATIIVVSLFILTTVSEAQVETNKNTFDNVQFHDIEITPSPTIKPTPTPTKHPKIAKPVVKVSGLILDSNVSWYGPGFYGKRTACGQAYTTTILGVANKTLPCGTLVTFSWKGKTITVPVIDRGPYVIGRQWDLSGALCTYLNHCFTGPLYYKIIN